MTRQVAEDPEFVTCLHCMRDFRAITYLHLKNIHGYKGEHPISDYKSKFGIPFAMSLDTRQKISEAKDDFWAKLGRHWTPARVLLEIRRIHQSGRASRKEAVPVRLYEAARRIYGSWEEAVEEAGFDYEETSGLKRWTQEKVVNAIRSLAEKGLPLTSTSVQKHDPGLVNAAIKLFPYSWAKALEAAGFRPEEHREERGVWNRDRAAEWVRDAAARGDSLLARDTPSDLLQFVHARLQTGWVDFVESQGFPYPGVKKQRDWTPELLLSEIRLWKDEGHRMNYSAVHEEYQALIHQARKFFKTWEAAVEAAGLNYQECLPQKEWTKEKVVEAIRALAESGQPLYSNYVKSVNPSLVRAAIKRFPSSWAKALRAAGFRSEEHRQQRGVWNRDRAVDWVRDAAARGESILVRDVPLDLYEFVYKRLKTKWTDFVESLGFPYPGNRKPQRWTAELLLSEIRRWKAEGHELDFTSVCRGYQSLTVQARRFFGSWEAAKQAAGV